jgi:hypothetical protein
MPSEMSQVGLALRALAISFLYAGTFFLAAREKWMSGGVPEWFVKQFSPTLLGRFPGGLFLAYYKIAVLESCIALAVLVSVVKMEFWKVAQGESPVWLLGSLHLSLFVFAILGLGLRLTSDYVGAANLFFYFGATCAAILVLRI